MNTTFKAHLLKTLANKKGDKGFTLIELLVVVIIIGVLAAIALPNLLGQVGKARESEAKSTLGAMTRAQQSAFAERGRFARNIDELEIPVGNEKFYGIFIDIAAIAPANVPQRGWMGATGIDRDNTGAVIDIGKGPNGKNGTRDYAAGVTYDPLNRLFSTVVCRADNSQAMKDAQYVLHGNAQQNPNNNKTVVGSVTGLANNTGQITVPNAVSECGDSTEEIK
ncbi:type IV pilin protein [Crocosphaera sp.]|uniref:type IV pilin protein n=1 Tax=Crocosphaera sp. TaxID=2729996 RepID=UPI003F1EE021|nr:type IV pilin-like G/H family protein [Crocosphaera sp.]